MDERFLIQQRSRNPSIRTSHVTVPTQAAHPALSSARLGHAPSGYSPAGTAESGFKQVLEAALHRPLHFSGHARERLAQCRRSLTEQEQVTLAEAVDRAAQKGAREALVMMNDLALVVSIRNRTVITAVDGERMRANIFTNIDSAVIL